MSSLTDLDKDNIISATIEELSEKEEQAYLVAEEHFMAYFLKGFKKYHDALVKRVQEFMMPAFNWGNMLVNIFFNWGKLVSVMHCVSVCFHYL